MGTASEYILGELRLLRASLGISQDDFGKAIGYSGSHVSSVETGSRPPTKEYMQAIDRAYNTGERYARMLRELATLDQTPSWLREWIELEREATLLRWYEPAFVPGILQTEAYARAMLTTGLLPASDVEQQVASRLDRQGILTREAPVPLVAALDVMVLRRQINGHPGVMREQVEHLVKMAELPHVQILLVTEDAGVYPGLQGGFILATLNDGSVVAYLDHQVRAQLVNGTEELATLHQTWEAIRGETLPRRQSLELLKEVALTWT